MLDLACIHFELAVAHAIHRTNCSRRSRAVSVAAACTFRASFASGTRQVQSHRHPRHDRRRLRQNCRRAQSRCSTPLQSQLPRRLCQATSVSGTPLVSPCNACVAEFEVRSMVHNARERSGSVNLIINVAMGAFIPVDAVPRIVLILQTPPF
jgi:hypothetical protein